MSRLTKRLIDTLDAREKDYFEWDSDLAGFGIRVWPTGRRVYVAQYRSSGRTRRVKIGAHGALTVEEARRLAKGILGDVARGEDPAEEKATRRKTLSMADLCDRYLATAERGLIIGKRGAPKKSSTLATDRGRIERHIKPLLGNRLVTDISASDINRFIRDVAGGKTAMSVKTDKPRGRAIVTGGVGTAARTAGLLGGILSFAVSEGVIDRNPASGIKRPSGKRRERRLTEQEYRSLGRALCDASDDLETKQGLTAVWLLALTGCRLGEIKNLKWSEIDQASRCFRLEDSKEGASIRPVGGVVLDLLSGLQREPGTDYVLPAERSDGAYGGLPRAFRRVTARAKLEGVTPHTLRHSFASVSGDLGYSESTIAALLGHAAGSVTGRYIHHLDVVLLAAADRTSEAIFTALNERVSNG